jgi:putative phosphoribosyl transferase
MFKNRTDAGKKLSEKLLKFKNKNDSMVLGITRGGVIIADEISKKLNIPLDVIVIKKLNAPGNPELAVGAIGPGRTVFWDKRILKEVPITIDYKKHILKAKIAERKNLE